MDLGLEVSEQDDYAVLAVRGELDLYTSPRLRDRLVEIIGQGSAQVIVDLSCVDFLDSTGLGVLVGAYKRLRNNSGDLRIVCPRSPVRKVFEITGLSKVIGIFDTVQAAMSA